MMMTMKTSTFTSVPIRRERLAVERPHHAAEAGQRRAGHEHADEQPADAVAERLDHLAVLHAGADQQADLGAVEDEQHAAEHDEPDHDGDHAVLLDRRCRRGRTSRAALVGSGIGICEAPQITLISCSATIRPPM